MALDILEVIGKQSKFEYKIDTFYHFNKAQGNLSGYLKLKFPRARNVFVSDDLAEKFISFDEVENPKNDILSNAGVHFTDSQDLKIIK